MSAAPVPVAPSDPPPAAAPRLPGRRALLLATLTGVLLATSQVDLYPLAWVALAPLTLACAGRRVAGGAALGFLSGLLAGSALYGVATYGLLTYGMLVVYCGVHMALYGAVMARSFGRIGPWSDLVLPALAWTAFEVLRRVGTVSFPINLSATQVELLPLLQLAYWTGGHGVSFLIALPAGVLATWAWRGRFPGRQATAGVVVLVLTMTIGQLRLREPVIDDSKVRLTGVQTAFQNWLYELEQVSSPHKELLHESLFQLTEQAGAAGADLIVWPETALHERVLELPPLQERLTALARRHGSAILAGFFREDPQGLEHNSAVLFTPAGVGPIYDKRRLAGLAEWRITPGRELAPLATPHGAVGVLICLESVYPQDARELVRRGAELLVVTTNDAGFLFSPMAGFHGQRSILTAIESDRYLLHLSQAGPSYLLDPRGRALRATELFQSTLVAGEVGRRRTVSPYHRLGDWFAGLLYVGLAAALLTPAGRRRGVRPRPTP
ncbi:MAG: nitrilase-related carbon-nitrogen hydrolase [Myxococcota bacterium]|jgi:apolipoprotein N-acyltransferase|nr:nitrilase-related carbon-nitrogen hydrolase [Myxococcota bacterium]